MAVRSRGDKADRFTRTHSDTASHFADSVPSVLRCESDNAWSLSTSTPVSSAMAKIISDTAPGSRCMVSVHSFSVGQQGRGYGAPHRPRADRVWLRWILG
jgi:hypothetical protein